MCVSIDMSKNIRVGRSKKNLFFFQIFIIIIIFFFCKEVMAKLFLQLILFLLHPNNSENSTNR